MDKTVLALLERPGIKELRNVREHTNVIQKVESPTEREGVVAAVKHKLEKLGTKTGACVQLVWIDRNN